MYNPTITTKTWTGGLRVESPPDQAALRLQRQDDDCDAQDDNGRRQEPILNHWHLLSGLMAAGEK
jgi:hypothetical protein